MDDPVAALKARLGTELAVVDLLSAAECAGLLAMVNEASESQGKALDDSMTQSLDHFPKLLRGTARKILFG